MLAKCFGEFMGTLVLVLLGDGVVANVLLKRSKAEGAGWIVITSGWAFAVMAGVFTAIACGSGDAIIERSDKSLPRLVNRFETPTSWLRFRHTAGRIGGLKWRQERPRSCPTADP